MQAREKILDDVARVAGGAVSAFSSLRRQVKDEVRARIDELAQRLDLVPREDFDRVELMAFKAREEQANLIKRIEALEAQLGAAPKTKSKSKAKRK
ncbi:MAG: pyrroline-5-carboxylate reductase [Alphaproteobacteria bacterium PRO2]|nr:pyrroline-5-carboxylate reductase [Alphaproteobacteria bacterium PRO2]